VSHPLDPAAERTLALMSELGREHLGRPLQELGWTVHVDTGRPAYLHDSRRPLDEVIPELEVLAEAEESQGDLFADHGPLAECAGYCGV
jgi:hypothetical protein